MKLMVQIVITYKPFQYLPKRFARENGLINKKCDLVISDERQRSWNLKLNTYNHGVYIREGWHGLCVDNDLKEGDCIKFEVVTNGGKPIWKFHGAANHKPFGQSHFVCIVRRYCLVNDFLVIPTKFELANGLSNKRCDLIIRDERERSWNVKLRSSGNRVCIRDGWRKFSADNCLKEGDRIMFEIVAKGETQIWKFQVVSNAKKPMRKFQENAMEKPKPNVMSSHKDFPDVETAKDMPRGRPRFIYTITASCISKYFLHVPRQFARENGLRDRKCIITIRDEQQRPWVFKLYTATGNTFIAGGWRNFCAANFLMEGDRVMIEMFSKGEQPIFKIYGKANASLQPEEKKPNLDAVRVFTQGKPKPKIKTSSKASSKVEAAYKDTNLSHSHFICTIRPYSLSKYFLRIPKQFAQDNRLNNGKCNIIMRDEQSG
ncbi:hypothetical protein P3L10_003542 [Capsicum annuum]